MLTEAERQNVLQASELLAQQEQYEQALLMLEPLECIMACCLKGRIYLSMAKKMANSFEFKFYGTEDQKKQYREVLSHAYSYLYKTGCMKRSASYEIQERLPPYLWSEISKIEDELTRTWPVKDKSEDCEFADDFQVDKKHDIDSMIDQIEHCNL